MKNSCFCLEFVVKQKEVLLFFNMIFQSVSPPVYPLCSSSLESSRSPLLPSCCYIIFVTTIVYPIFIISWIIMITTIATMASITLVLLHEEKLFLHGLGCKTNGSITLCKHDLFSLTNIELQFGQPNWT